MVQTTDAGMPTASPTLTGPPSVTPARQVINVQGATYEQRYNCCHKLNCHHCWVHDRWIASHGPYFYLCLPMGRKWVRIYLGRHLDTSRFRAADGSIDFAAALASTRRSRDRMLAAPGVPVEEEIQTSIIVAREPAHDPNS